MINSFIKYLYNAFLSLGFDVRQLLRSIIGIPFYFTTWFAFRKTINKNEEGFKIAFPMMYLADRFDTSGAAKGHYFHQDLLIAKNIFKSNPIKHVDVGSRIDGFVAHVASFREIEVFDIRDLKSNIPNIVFKQADLTDINFPFLNYCDSISSLHAIEHFGLGRYGDTPDYSGYLKGLNNIYKLLKSGGTFYFSVPIGEQQIVFNAHRIFSISYLLKLFSEKYQLKSFSLVDDKGNLFENLILTHEMIKNNCNCTFGCGIFELIKI